MKRISRYLMTRLGSAIVLTLIALMALFSFFEVIAAVGNVGKGSYSIATLFIYVGLQLFGHFYTLMPLAVLVGSLLAISQLVLTSEFTVIRTSGASLRRIILSIGAVGLLFGLIGMAVGEWLAPKMAQKAEQIRLNAIQAKVSLGSSGLWFRQGQDIVNVREMLPDGKLINIKIYHYDDKGNLSTAWLAQSGEVHSEHNWLLHHVAQTQLLANRTQTQTLAQATWQTDVNQNLLSALLIDPDQMSLQNLSEYIQHLQENQQQTTSYQTALWRKLFYPISCMIMTLVALAFAPQHVRKGNIGLRLFLGICLGLAYHFISRLSGYTVSLTGLPPIIAALLPTLVFALLALWLIRRNETR